MTSTAQKWFTWSGDQQLAILTPLGPTGACMEFLDTVRHRGRLHRLGPAMFASPAGFHDPTFTRPTRKFFTRCCPFPLAAEWQRWVPWRPYSTVEISLATGIDEKNIDAAAHWGYLPQEQADPPAYLGQHVALWLEYGAPHENPIHPSERWKYDDPFFGEDCNDDQTAD